VIADLSRLRRDDCRASLRVENKNAAESGGGDEDGGNDVPDRRLLHRGPV
jgi:hypothetical protein